MVKNNAPAPIPNQSTLSFREGLQEFLLHMSGPRQPQTQNEIWVLSARGMTELFQPLWVNPISQSGKSSAMPRGGDYPHLCQLCPQPEFGPDIQSLKHESRMLRYCWDVQLILISCLSFSSQYLSTEQEER